MTSLNTGLQAKIIFYPSKNSTFPKVKILIYTVFDFDENKYIYLSMLKISTLLLIYELQCSHRETDGHCIDTNIGPSFIF